MAELFEKQDVKAALDLLSPTSEPDVERALVRQHALQTRDRWLERAARRGQRSTFMTNLIAPFAAFRRRAAAVPVATAALVVLALLTPPGQGLASQFLTIFRVRDFQAITIDTSGGAPLAGIPDLTRFGDVSPSSPRHVEPEAVADVAAASSAVGFPVKVPSTLPSGLSPTPRRVEVTREETVTFSFRADRTRAYLDSIGHSDFALPQKFDGASIQVNIPAAVLVFAPAGMGVTSSLPGDSGRLGSLPTGPGALDSVMVVQAKSPTVEAAGVSFEELRDFLLSLPGLPPQTAAQIRAIGDLTTTLPVPVPTGTSAREIQVNGGPGLIVAEQGSRLAGGIVWQQNGMLYAIGGPLNEGDLMAIAGSMR